MYGFPREGNENHAEGGRGVEGCVEGLSSRRRVWLQTWSPCGWLLEHLGRALGCANTVRFVARGADSRVISSPWSLWT